MTTDDPYDYSPRTSSGPSPMIPVILLALSLLLILIWQVINLAKQGTGMKDARVQLTQAVEKREVAVKQSGELQAKLQSLAVDLLELSKTDEQAKAIIQKYNIQKAGEGEQPAPAPAP